MTQGKKINFWKTRQSLFQHVGVFRSLGGFQPLQENKFGTRLFDNPKGTVFTNMSTVPSYDAKFAYWSVANGNEDDRNDECDLKTKEKKKRCFFWAKTIEPHDHVTLVFDNPIPMKAALVEMGADKHEKD